MKNEIFFLEGENLIVHKAIKQNQFEEARTYLDSRKVGINFLVSDLSNSRLIHEIVERGDIEQIRFVLSYKPNLDEPNSLGTPLIIAATSRFLGKRMPNIQLDIVKLLVEEGNADLNTTTTIDNEFLPKVDGYTVLHAATQMNNKPMVEYLLAKGADINAVKVVTERANAQKDRLNEFFYSQTRINNSFYKETPLDIAMRLNARELVAYFREKNAVSAISNTHSNCYTPCNIV
jgi:ankyrin repeat protein